MIHGEANNSAEPLHCPGWMECVESSVAQQNRSATKEVAGGAEEEEGAHFTRGCYA